MSARIEAEGRGRNLRIRFYARAPGEFRLEARGPVGGILVVATGRDGRWRIVLPSRRLYAEGLLEEEVGSALIGVPLSGCDLAMVMRISTGLKDFRPCGGSDPQPEDPAGSAVRPGLIVDTSVSGKELVRFGWDWSGSGPYPREVRVETVGEAQAMVALTAFRDVPGPSSETEGLFWEPIPDRATAAPLHSLTEAGSP